MRIFLSLLLISACTSPEPEDELDSVDEAATTPALTLARTFVVDGGVFAAVTDGTTLYMGGNFRYIGERSGQLALVSGDTGARDKAITELGGGGVFAIVADGSGGYFVAGDFRKTGSFTNRALAHVRADGTYDPAWRFEIQGAVYALAADSTRVYVAGSFALINGQPRRNFAAFDIATGALVSGTPSVSGMIRSMSYGSGHVFVGGDFDGEGGFIQRIDTATMTVASWNPGQPDGSVQSLLAYGSGVYVGGYFTHFGAIARNHVASIDQSTAVVRPYNPSTDQGVFAMQRLGSVLYLGGGFTTVGGQPRSGVAAVDASTGAVLPFHATVAGDGSAFVRTLLPTSSALYFGGYFQSVNGTQRPWAAAVNPTTGALLPWNPHPSGQVLAMTSRGSGVLLGGVFISVNGSDRHNFAAIDLSTGKATSWAPTTAGSPPNNDVVSAMALRGSTIWVGGRFTGLNGVARNNIGALSTAGATLPFQAATDGDVNTIAATSARIYVGGNFTFMNTSPRDHLAAVDPTTGATLSWAPGIGGQVRAVVVAGPRLYAGGFGSFLGAWDVNGVAQPVPTVNGPVLALAYDGTDVYIGGQYSSIGGQARNSLAATVPGTATVTSWAPVLSQFTPVRAIGVSPSYVYASADGLRTFSKSTAALQTFSPTGGAGEGFIVRPDRLIIYGVGEVNYTATGGIAEFMGTP